MSNGLMLKKKTNQQWLWYGFDRETNKISAFYIGKRNDESCKKLFDKLSHYDINCYNTDNWSSYEKFIPKEKHIHGKIGTQRIERNNLNLRTHIKRLTRKTICFSKKEDMHQNVIKIYIDFFNSK